MGEMGILNLNLDNEVYLTDSESDDSSDEENEKAIWRHLFRKHSGRHKVH